MLLQALRTMDSNHYGKQSHIDIRVILVILGERRQQYCRSMTYSDFDYELLRILSHEIRVGHDYFFTESTSHFVKSLISHFVTSAMQICCRRPDHFIAIRTIRHRLHAVDGSNLAPVGNY